MLSGTGHKVWDYRRVLLAAEAGRKLGTVSVGNRQYCSVLSGTAIAASPGAVLISIASGEGSHKTGGRHETGAGMSP